MDRIEKLCSYLNPCSTFADVGCDHGYCAQFVLENSLCEKAVISDISPKCLKKAERLLKKYLDEGKCLSVCCAGLEKIDPDTELVLIAGMGGEEIVSILDSSFIPRNFVFQPMKNVRELRKYLLKNGAEISRDDLFSSCGKYYFVLCGSKNGNKSVYTDAQLEYGKGDLNGELGYYLKGEHEKNRGYLQKNLSEESRLRIVEKVKFIEGVLSGEIK